MVEALKVKHPEYATRLRAAAEKSGVGKEDIRKGMKCTPEMARRYWNGIAKPRTEAKLSKLAEIVGATAAELEFGERTPAQRQEVAPYARLSKEAVEIARAWEKLSPLKKQLYREVIFRDAAAETVLPWLKSGRPITGTYDIFEQRVERDYHQHVKQLKLDI